VKNFKPKLITQETVGEGEENERQKAILLLARILTSCRPSNVTFISLEHPNPKTNGDSEGYKLHFKWSIDDITFNIIKDIVMMNHLGFREHNDGRLVIYTPKRDHHKTQKT
jgi:hypothetical protein